MSEHNQEFEIGVLLKGGPLDGQWVLCAIGAKSYCASYDFKRAHYVPAGDEKEVTGHTEFLEFSSIS